MSLLSLPQILPVLGQSAGGSPLGLDLGTVAGTGTTAPSLDLDGALASLAQALAAPPISTPELSGLSGLVNSVLDAGSIDANVDLNVNLGTPGEPLLDLGVSLGSDGSVLDLGAEVLDPNAGGSMLDVDLNLGTATGTATPSLDLSPVVDLLTGTTPTALSTGLPQLPALGELVNDVVEAVGLDNIVDIEMGSGTPSSPALELDVALGGSGSAEPAIDPSTDMVSDPGTATIPSTTASEPASLPDLVNEVIDAVGLDDLLGIDLGSVAAPSTSAPATPATPATSGTGTTVGADVTVGSGGVSVGVSGSGGSIGTGGTSVPAPSGGTTGGGVSGGVEVSTGSGGGTSTVGTGAETSTGGGHGGSVIHVGHGSGIGTSQAIDLDQRHWMDGSNGNDTIMASNGSDTVYGHDGNDALFANQGADRIFGGQGDDYLRGGRGDDMVSGGDGDDHIWGDLGDDVLEGGDGADVFYFALNSGHDVILNFNYAQGDRLDFQGQDYSVTEADGAAIVQLSGGGHIALHGISAAEFNSYAFA